MPMFKGEGRSTLEDRGHQLGRSELYQLVSQDLCQPHVKKTMKMRASRNYEKIYRYSISVFLQILTSES